MNGRRASRLIFVIVCHSVLFFFATKFFLNRTGTSQWRLFALAVCATLFAGIVLEIFNRKTARILNVGVPAASGAVLASSVVWLEDEAATYLFVISLLPFLLACVLELAYRLTIVSPDSKVTPPYPAKKRFLVIAASLVAVAVALTCFPHLWWSTLGVAEDAISAGRKKLEPLFPFLRSAAEPRPAAGSIEPYTDADGYAVIVAWKRHWAQQYAIILRREISPDPHVRKGEFPDATWLPADLRFRYRPAINDLVSKWNQPRFLEERFGNPAEFLVRPESTLPVNDDRKGIPANASGYFAVSAVGFDHSRCHAAIYVIHRDGRYGDGAIFLLSKDADGTWHVENGVNVWIT